MNYKNDDNNLIWADKWSMNILNKIFRIIQTELSYIISFMGNQDTFSCLSNLLFQKFHNEYMNKKDMEKSIEMKINDLEKYKFLAPNDISDETEFMEDEYEEISFEKVLDLIKSLRKKRINIFKTLLEDFKNNKEKYLNFMKNQDYTYF
ncbi:MAG: hypothetical protein P8Y97_23000 [Candidatus Lokiarchaeota archaeon]